MMRYYCKETGSTYIDYIHGASIPPSAVPITDELYLEVIANPAPGKIRSHDAKGLPILIDPPPPPAPTREQIEAQRLRAYADPLTGSDQLFSESMRMQIMGEEGHEDVRARAIARFEEIQAQYPWKAI